MNRNVYYALKSEGEDYTYVDALNDVSFNGGSEITFSLDFYGLENGTLFEQGNSVSCIIQDGLLYWKTAFVGTLISSSQTPFVENEWNHIDIVYQSSKIIAYINGLKSNELDITIKKTVATAPYIFLKKCRHYLRNVRVCDSALTDVMILSQLVQTTIEKDHLLLYIPFDCLYPQDLGKYEKSVHCQGFSRCETIVTSLNIFFQGYVVLLNEKINIGSQSNPKGSLLFRVYLEPSPHQTVLYANEGDDNELFLIQIENGLLDIQIGQFHQTDTKPLSFYQWQTIVITYENQKISYYVEGELWNEWSLSSYIRTSSASIYLCGREDRDVSLVGTMDMFAIYDDVLTKEQIANYQIYDPFIYDEHIQSLFIFHDSTIDDYLSDAKALLYNAKIDVFEGTETFAQDQIIQYQSQGSFEVEDFYQWETDIATDVFSSYVLEAMGMSALTITPAFSNYVYNQIVDTAEMQQLICEYRTMPPDKIKPILTKYIKKPKVRLNLLKGLFPSAMTGATVITASKQMEYSFAVESVIGAALLTMVIAKVAEKMKGKHDDPPPPPYQPTKDYLVSLNNVTFYHQDNGSVRLRKDDVSLADVPEWTRTTSGVCAYIGKQQQPKIKVNFHYETLNPLESVSVVIYGQGDLLGLFESSPVLCMASGDYETTITLNHNQISQTTALGKHLENISWSYSYIYGKRFMQSINMDIYIIHQPPMQPWSLSDENHLITVEQLKIFDDILSLSKCKSRQLHDVLNSAVKWIMTKQNIVFQQQNQYASIQSGLLYFSDKNFHTDWKKGTIQIGALDICVYIMSLLFMNGYSCSISRIAGTEGYVRYKQSSPEVATTGLMLNKHYILGVENKDILLTHYIINVDDIIYDLVLSDENKQILSNVSFDIYKKTISQASSSFIKATIISRYFEKEAISFSLQITYTTSSGFLKGVRPDFKDYIKNQFYYPQNNACCHRISYSVIETILCTIFNRLKDGIITKAQKDEMLMTIFNTFYPEELADEEEENRVLLKNVFTELLKVTQADCQNFTSGVLIGRYLTTALGCLNSCSRNLRTGYTSWNSSIGVQYDSVSWFYVFPNIIDQQHIEYRKICNQNGLIQQIEVVELPEGIYFDDNIDGGFIHLLKSLEAVLQEELLEIPFAVYPFTIGEAEGILPIVYSSNNEYDLRLADCAMGTVNYYYLNPETGLYDSVY